MVSLRIQAGQHRCGNDGGYWLKVADDGQRLDALEATMKRHLDQAVGSRATHLLVFASVTAFLVGCGLAGWGMLT
jgi:hypothetical protein